MDNFTDYTYYQKECNGKLTEEQYQSVRDKATLEIINRTQGAVHKAPECMDKMIKQCECALIDAFAGFELLSVPSSVTNISNDGLSISFGGVTPSEALRKEARKICKQYLEYPYNLLCGWT